MACSLTWQEVSDGPISIALSQLIVGGAATVPLMAALRASPAPGAAVGFVPQLPMIAALSLDELIGAMSRLCGSLDDKHRRNHRLGPTEDRGRPARSRWTVLLTRQLGC
jgi:hypothetical protein